MLSRIHELPAVLTSFAYREEYFPELEGMLATVRRHHPDWLLVTGKGPVAGVDHPAFKVQSSAGELEWRAPVFFRLDGSENDWMRIVWMKAWWVAEVWHQFGDLGGMASTAYFGLMQTPGLTARLICSLTRKRRPSLVPGAALRARPTTTS